MRLFRVPGVFRPRSDSRLLAGIAAARMRPGDRVLDPFTGSGILAVAAAEAGGDVTAIDVSRRAVACAWLNGRLNGARVRALRGDMFGPVAGERFDLIVANPPYVPGEVDGRVRGAARAWEGGADGRWLLDRLCDEAPAHLRPGGELLVVHSDACGEGATVARLEARGLAVELVERRRGTRGPLMARRLGPGDEELLVFSARAAGNRAAPWPQLASPHIATAPTWSAASSS
jgi:release factor glutamine methyltransferase